MRSYKFKTTDLVRKHFLNEAINNILEREQIKIKDTDIAYDFGLEQDYCELLEKFEKHIKIIIEVNKNVR